VVNFSGPESLLGQFVSVEITEVMPNSLRGRYIALAADSSSMSEEIADLQSA
ncbi:MAG: TRAM domain-containing protein, partial [Gammaproteobacteria bacterium]|nr:TRAM domain-containing protein [Gammaproteobacteria bacterium]